MGIDLGTGNDITVFIPKTVLHHIYNPIDNLIIYGSGHRTPIGLMTSMDEYQMNHIGQQEYIRGINIDRKGTESVALDYQRDSNHQRTVSRLEIKKYDQRAGYKWDAVRIRDK